MQNNFDEKTPDAARRALIERLQAAGLLDSKAFSLEPLTGGVSSEIYLVKDGETRFVVKEALSKLRVQDDWHADTSRNQTERLYLEYVGKIMPSAVPRVIGSGPGFFAMEFLGTGFSNWKELLLRGEGLSGPAAAAGRVLGAIHAASSGDVGAGATFDTFANFHQLRIAPYLLTTGQRNPSLNRFFLEAAEQLEATRECLVHGDFSPKNLLVSGDRMVVVDCEVAWYGDPAFDLAFLINHLCLKAMIRPADAGRLHRSALDFLEYYSAARQQSATSFAHLLTRTARLLTLLMLARVDGKSPVEYLTAAHRFYVGGFARREIGNTNLDLTMLLQKWFSQIP